MSTQRLVRRQVMQLTVQQLAQAIKGLQGDIARIHYRLVVTERIVKVKLGLEKEEVDAIVEAMIKEGEDTRKKQAEEAAVVAKLNKALAVPLPTPQPKEPQAPAPLAIPQPKPQAPPPALATVP